MAVATGERLRFLWLEVTGRCQLRCSHCYSSSGPTGDRERYLSSVQTAVPNFYAGLRIPDLEYGGVWAAGPNQEPRLAGLDDSSWARVQRAEDGGCQVVQGGPRRLWDLYEAAVEEWMELGRPVWTRFGMTITSDRRQVVWLDRPDSGHAWEV
jgi:hypothetical protein